MKPLKSRRSFSPLTPSLLLKSFPHMARHYHTTVLHSILRSPQFSLQTRAVRHPPKPSHICRQGIPTFLTSTERKLLLATSSFKDMTVLCDQCASRKRCKDHGRHDLRLKHHIRIAETCTARAFILWRPLPHTESELHRRYSG